MGTVAAARRTTLVVTVKSYAAPYVSSDAGTLAGALVLRPSAAVDRLPPVHGEPSPIADRAREQHAVLVGTLRDRGVTVHEIEPQSESPTESLVADCALMVPRGAVIARPSQIERRAEVAVVEAQLTELGVPIAGRIAAPGLLDATDVALGANCVFVGVPRPGAGLRARSNAFGRQQLASLAGEFGFRYVELALANDVVRLRDVFSIIAADTRPVPPKLLLIHAALDARHPALAIAVTKQLTPQIREEGEPTDWIAQSFLPNLSVAERASIARGLADAQLQTGDLRAAFLYAGIAQFIAPSDAGRRTLGVLRTQLENLVKNDARRPMVNDSLDQDRLVRPKVGAQ